MLKNHDAKEYRYLLRVLVGVVVFWMIAHILSVFVTFSTDNTFYLGVAYAFDLDNEYNLPTVYSALLWSCAAFTCLMLLASTRSIADKVRWIGLGLLFLYAAFDEVLVLHEGIAQPIRDVLAIADDSIVYHAWVIPAAILLGLATFVMIGIKGVSAASREQKSILRLLLAVAAIIVSLEIVGTQLYFSEFVYKLGPVLIEETLEMGIVSVILYRLVSYTSTYKLKG